jgi:hypothetical protein
LWCPDLWLQCSVSFVHGFKKSHHTRIILFFKPCTKLTLYCNHRSGHLKTEHTESLLIPGPQSKHEKLRQLTEVDKTETRSISDTLGCMVRDWSVYNKSVFMLVRTGGQTDTLKVIAKNLKFFAVNVRKIRIRKFSMN